MGTPDVNARGGLHDSALQAALSRGQENIVQLLIQKGADVNAMGGFFGSPLHAATLTCSAPMVQLLIANGVNVNTQVLKSWHFIGSSIISGI